MTDNFIEAIVTSKNNDSESDFRIILNIML